MKLLLIEDDLPLAESLCQCLKKNNFAVDLCQTYSQAEINLDVNEYDCNTYAKGKTLRQSLL